MVELEGCGGSWRRNLRKPQDSIKSQTGVMAKKLKKVWEMEGTGAGGEGGGAGEMRGEGGGAGEMRGFCGVVHVKTPGLYQVPNLRNLFCKKHESPLTATLHFYNNMFCKNMSCR